MRPRLLVAPFLLLGACSNPSSAPSPTGSARAAIEGGVAAPDDTAVVVLWTSQLEEYCTGSLIAPNLVLTAAHCVATTVSAGQSCSQFSFDGATEPSNLIFSNAVDAPGSTLDYVTAAEVIPLPADGDLTCAKDLALVVLSEPLSTPPAAFLVPRVDGPVAVGEAFAAVGYGGVDSEATDIGSRRRLDGLTVACTEQCMKPFWLAPEWIGSAAVAHTGGRPGDSGSPALDASARVIGVFVRHLEYPDTSTSKDVLVYESVDSAGDWLKAGAAHAAEVGGYEPAPWVTGWPTDPAYSFPIGGPCGEACPSGLCSSDECTRICNDAAPCPEDHACVANERGVDVCDPISDVSTGGSGGTGGGAGADDDDPDGCAVAPAPTRRARQWLALAGLFGALLVRRTRSRSG